MRFINKLRNNIKDVLSIHQKLSDFDRTVVLYLPQWYRLQEAGRVFRSRIFWYSSLAGPVYKFEKDVEVLKKELFKDIMTEPIVTVLPLKWPAKRSDHDFCSR